MHRRVRKKSDELLYTAWSLVTVRNQLPEQAANITGVRVNELTTNETGIQINR